MRLSPSSRRRLISSLSWGAVYTSTSPETLRTATPLAFGWAETEKFILVASLGSIVGFRRTIRRAMMRDALMLSIVSLRGWRVTTKHGEGRPETQDLRAGFSGLGSQVLGLRSRYASSEASTSASSSCLVWW